MKANALEDMTQEDKELLLKDLCARLPYGVICDNGITIGKLCGSDIDKLITEKSICVKPYLHPMSSMTEEEMEKYKTISIYGWVRESKVGMTDICPTIEGYDWLNAHHFDYHGLIEKGLALKAPEGMYNKY